MNTHISRDRDFDFLDIKKLAVLPKIDVTIAQPRPRGALAYNVNDDTIWYSDGVEWKQLVTGFANAYGYAIGANDEYTIDADADVVFNLGATPSLNLGDFTDSTTFTATMPGIYQFNLYVIGNANLDDERVMLCFAIYVNHSSVQEFKSGVNINSESQLVCTGDGMITLRAGDEITLHNRTTTVLGDQTAVYVRPGAAFGGDNCTNRALTLRRLY